MDDDPILIQLMAALLANPNVWSRNQPDKALDDVLDMAIVAAAKLSNYRQSLKSAQVGKVQALLGEVLSELQAIDQSLRDPARPEVPSLELLQDTYAAIQRIETKLEAL
ncbi:MAG: hypothetical protein KGQ93_12390 [Cyanobacteria bacterium REEB459]|nr:hypothetical protein [Cyanobacteria bacterium REEB459]